MQDVKPEKTLNALRVVTGTEPKHLQERFKAHCKSENSPVHTYGAVLNRRSK